MSLFSFLNKDPRPGTKAYRRMVCKMISRKVLRCTVKREEDGSDRVIGRAGDLQLKNGKLYVYDGGNVLFLCSADELDAGELLSHDGVSLIGPNEVSGGERWHLLCYYRYYRNVN